MNVGEHAAAKIVGGRNHRNGLFENIDARLAAFFVHGGKARGNILLHAAHVQIQTGRAVVQHFVHHGLGHHIARGKVAPWVVVEHEWAALVVEQACALTAHCLGDERAAVAAFFKQGRGVKLHELEIGEVNARTKGHGNARAHTAGGVGGMQKNLPHAAGGKHCPVGQNGFCFAGFLIEHIGSEAAVAHLVAVLRSPRVVVAGQKVDGGAAVQPGDARVGQHLGAQALHDGAARIIGAVQNARGRVPALAREVERAVFVAVKGNLGAVDQYLVHAQRALRAQITDGLVVVVIVPGNQNVFFQRLGVRGMFRCGGCLIDDATLGKLGVAIGQPVTSIEQQNVAAGVGQCERSGASGNAGTDDEHWHMTANRIHSANLSFRRLQACGLGRDGRGGRVSPLRAEARLLRRPRLAAWPEAFFP